MKWIVTISDHGYPSVVYDFHASDEEAAKTKALACYQNYVWDACREFDHEEDLPIVLMYEAPKEPIFIELAQKWKQERIEQEERQKKQEEASERMHFERLQKKFGDK